MLYLCLLLVLTLTPRPPGAAVLADLDKLGHAVLFGGLSALTFWNLDLASRVLGALTAFVAATVCAGAIELLQAPLPQRTADPADLVAGALGALLGGAIALLIVHRPGARQDRAQSSDRGSL